MALRGLSGEERDSLSALDYLLKAAEEAYQSLTAKPKSGPSVNGGRTLTAVDGLPIFDPTDPATHEVLVHWLKQGNYITGHADHIEECNRSTSFNPESTTAGDWKLVSLEKIRERGIRTYVVGPWVRPEGSKWPPWTGISQLKGDGGQMVSKKKTKGAAKTGKRKAGDRGDEDEDEDEVMPAPKRKRQPAKRAGENDGDEEKDETKPAPKRRRQPPAKKAGDREDEDEDELKPAPKKKRQPAKKTGDHDEDERKDETKPAPKRKRQAPAKKAAAGKKTKVRSGSKVAVEEAAAAEGLEKGDEQDNQASTLENNEQSSTAPVPPSLGTSGFTPINPPSDRRTRSGHLANFPPRPLDRPVYAPSACAGILAQERNQAAAAEKQQSKRKPAAKKTAEPKKSPVKMGKGKGRRR
ncbi:MAG: hypothetical protein Q9201_007932 [Fulgogasparrea decipioides]